MRKARNKTRPPRHGRTRRDSNNSFDAKGNLVSKFAIEETVAEFVLNMELAQMDKYMNNADFQKKEIAKWKALKEIINNDDLAD